ncbi:MAG: hypothetical protein ACYS7Y_36355 [Planctomycetota bacterium]|jgi:hypothetical protein
MTKRPPKYGISVSISLNKGDDEYAINHRSVARISLTEDVTSGTDPVEYLRTVINREFKRKFKDLDLPYELDVISDE